MGCPEIDQLIDLFHGRGDRELDDHVRTCPSCQADLKVIFLLPSAMSFDVEVPERLVARVLDALSKPVAEDDVERVSVGQRLTTGVIGFTTMAAALVVSGSAGAAVPMVFVLISLGAGLAVGISHPWFGRWNRDISLGP